MSAMAKVSPRCILLRSRDTRESSNYFLIAVHCCTAIISKQMRFDYSTGHYFRILLTFSGRNPLHLAARGNYTQTVELLHSVHSHLLDQVDKDGVSGHFGDVLVFSRK